ncbi:MAG: vitamin K epoxide reductase family protein [Synechococcaceae cyanobacterium]|nr:vitamin K epoxide reductase family protein [Synechococcaceae cyanobacterium]
MTSSRLSERLGSRRRSDPVRRWIRVVMAVLATIGAIDTGSITLKRWGLLGPLACPGGAEGCDKVLNSPWGTVLGQPLSLFGFLAYTAVLVMALLPLVLRGEGRTGHLQRTRWGLFLLTTAMAVFSVLLMAVMVVAIPAHYGAATASIWCFFCVLSALLSISLMALSLAEGGWEDRGQLVFRGVLLALLVGIVGIGWATAINRPAVTAGRGEPIPVEAASTPATIALADHLTSTGAVMYSAYWCPHCHEQKELFGKEATARLKIVECAPDGRDSQAELCEAKGVKGFPTWELAGRLDSGVKSLAQLAGLSGYRGPTGF